jgi:hypothetical protein
MMVENGQTLPSFRGVLDGEEVDVSTLGRDSWTVVLLYRGHW